MRNVTIDLGNTRIKVGFFEKQVLLKKAIVESYEDIIQQIDFFSPDNIILCSVYSHHDFENILKKYFQIIVVSPFIDLPIKIDYKTPETLGKDRIAAAIGAWTYAPFQNSLIIDSGSCITYDFVSDSGVFEGGCISPGFQMKLKALNFYTAKLPLLEIPHHFHNKQIIPLGKTTQESILEGVLIGTLLEIKGIVYSYKSLYPQLQIILCGGDAELIKKNLPEIHFLVQEDLVLFGLNQIPYQ
ncbi:MAG: type III pantothenate kinase [Chitinophagaceae bacterium]|nr:type III pantothenate kinase [Chitinophagaceae bacterium]